MSGIAKRGPKRGPGRRWVISAQGGSPRTGESYERRLATRTASPFSKRRSRRVEIESRRADSLRLPPQPGTVPGTRTVTAVNGVATFSDLSIDQLGNGYTLSGSS